MKYFNFFQMVDLRNIDELHFDAKIIVSEL